MVGWIIVAAFAFIWAGICKTTAHKKKLDEAFWFVMGLFFGVFAAIGVLCATDKS